MKDGVKFGGLYNKSGPFRGGECTAGTDGGKEDR